MHPFAPGATAAALARPARHRILDAARALIEERRYPASIRAIASAADVAVSTIYEHFPNRDAIAQAVVDELFLHDAPPIGASLQADLEQLVAHRAAHLATNRRLVLGLLALPETQVRVGHRAALHDPELAGTRRIFEAHRAALVSSLDPRTAAELAGIGLRGALLGALEERSHYLADPAFLAEVVAMLEHAVSAAPRPAGRWAARSHAHTYQRAEAPTSPLRKRPTQPRSREIIEAVVEGTQRVVERHGVDAITTPRVAKATGVSVGSLYQYFGNRTSLLGALVDRWMQRDLGFIEQRVAQETSPSAAVLLEHLAIETHRRFCELARIYRGIFAVFPRIERAAAVRDFLALSREVICRAVAARGDAEGIDCELMIFVQGHAMTAWCRALTTERPELLASPQLPELMVRIARGAAPR